jgi:hypothetical protein
VRAGQEKRYKGGESVNHRQRERKECKKDSARQHKRPRESQRSTTTEQREMKTISRTAEQ